MPYHNLEVQRKDSKHFGTVVGPVTAFVQKRLFRNQHRVVVETYKDRHCFAWTDLDDARALYEMVADDVERWNHNDRQYALLLRLG